jgi:hypothetical protein
MPHRGRRCGADQPAYSVPARRRRRCAGVLRRRTGLRRAHRGVAAGARPPGGPVADHRDRLVLGRGYRSRTRGPRNGDGAGPIGPAPSLPLDEIDIRTDDDWSTGEFVRRLWWQVTAPLDGRSWLSACAAVYVTDIYGIDPVLQVHGHSMTDRSHRTATTDSSIWFHRPIRAGEWNLLESRSPAAARGRGLVTLNLYDADLVLTATLVQEGLAILRT